VRGTGVPERLLLKALEAWRSGERVLETLPPDTFGYEVVLTAVARLRNAHAELAARLGAGSTVDRESYQTIIDEAASAIREVEEPAG
jgi:hypothetical protein